MFEMARSEKDERRVFADIIKDVIAKRGNPGTPGKDKDANFDITSGQENIKDVANAAKKHRRNRSQLAMAGKDDKCLLSSRNNNSTLENQQ
jgi:hypothetical protein